MCKPDFGTKKKSPKMQFLFLALGQNPFRKRSWEAFQTFQVFHEKQSVQTSRHPPEGQWAQSNSVDILFSLLFL